MPTKQELLADTRNNWETISASMFTQGTVGARIFGLVDPGYATGLFPTHFLEGRKRSKLLLDRPVTDLWAQTARTAITQNIGTMTVRDLLSLPNDDTYERIRAASPTLEARVTTYLRNFAISPAAHLFYDIFGLSDNPVPFALAMEPFLETAMDTALNRLSQLTTFRRGKQIRSHDMARERDVLIIRYGLHSGVPETLETAGKAFGVIPERIRQLEVSAIRYLRLPSIVNDLRQFLPH